MKILLLCWRDSTHPQGGGSERYLERVGEYLAAQGLRQVAALQDPVGEVLRGHTMDNGIQMKQVRVPLGVMGMVYEARPNVTVSSSTTSPWS